MRYVPTFYSCTDAPDISNNCPARPTFDFLNREMGKTSELCSVCSVGSVARGDELTSRRGNKQMIIEMWLPYNPVKKSNLFKCLYDYIRLIIHSSIGLNTL